MLGVKSTNGLVDEPGQVARILIVERQKSPEKIRELQKRLKQDREHLKKVASALHQAGKSQEEAAAAVGVPRTTLEGWESNTSIDESVITCTPLDLRIKVGKAEHPRIYDRVKAGELRLRSEARLGELIKQEQEAGRLAISQNSLKQYRTNNDVSTVKHLKDYGLNWQDSSRAQKVAEHQDLIPVVVASAEKSKDLPTRKGLEILLRLEENKDVEQKIQVFFARRILVIHPTSG